MVCYKSVSHFEVEKRFDCLSREAEICGIIPELSYLVIVDNPRGLLNEDEIRLINTGEEDIQLRATFNLMPNPLRFVLKNGYEFNSDTAKFKEYMTGQAEWVHRAEELWHDSHGRKPTGIELAKNYIQSGGSLFYHIRYLLLHPECFEKRREFLRVPRGDELIQSLYDIESCKVA